MATPTIWLVDDSKDMVEFHKQDILEKVPTAQVLHYETPFDAWKSGTRPTVMVFDMSAVGSLLDPWQCYSPICTCAAHFPGCPIIINSAVSEGFAQEVVDQVREGCPDSVVELADWRGRSGRGLIDLIVRYC